MCCAVWTLLNQSISSSISANISFEVPRHVLVTNSSLCGFFTLTPTAPSEREEGGGGGEDVTGSEWRNSTESSVVFPVTLARQQSSPAVSAGRRRSLLDRSATATVTATVTATSPAGDSDSPPAPGHALHSHFVHYPLILRHIELYGVLDTKSINPLFATSLQPRDRAFLSSREEEVRGQDTAQVFSPLLWLDDLSIPAKHSFPLQHQPRPAPPPGQASGAPSEEPSPAAAAATSEPPQQTPHMSFAFQFAPTSLLYFGFKRVVQTNMRVIREVAGEDTLNELRYWLSEDRLFMMLCTQVVGWLHITFEYLAFRDDFQFFKVRSRSRTGAGNKYKLTLTAAMRLACAVSPYVCCAVLKCRGARASRASAPPRWSSSWPGRPSCCSTCRTRAPPGSCWSAFSRCPPPPRPPVVLTTNP